MVMGGHAPLRFVVPDRRGTTLDRKLVNQQNGCMKTTLDLPDGVVKQVKLLPARRAQAQGRGGRFAPQGLAADAAPAAEAAVIAKDKKTGLPLIECKQAASPQDEMTPERVADILLAQEAGWHHAAGR